MKRLPHVKNKISPTPFQYDLKIELLVMLLNHLALPNTNLPSESMTNTFNGNNKVNENLLLSSSLLKISKSISFITIRDEYNSPF